MAQANVVSITSAVEAERVLGPVESKAENAYRMADILVGIVEDTLGDQTAHERIFGGRKNCYYIDDDTVKSLIFAAYDVKDRIGDVRDALVEMIPA